MRRSHRVGLVGVALASSIAVVALLISFSSASEGPIAATLEWLGTAVGSMEHGIRQRLAGGLGRTGELAWFRPYRAAFAWGFGRYKFQHEPIFYTHVADQKDAWYGDKTQSTLWNEKKPAANRIHPTAKPVELVERALLNSSKVGETLSRTFSGGPAQR
jgi:hypothetical protein